MIIITIIITANFLKKVGKLRYSELTNASFFLFTLG